MLAGLDQQVAAGGQPVGRPGGHAPQHVQPVRATVQGHQRLVRAGLRREEPDLPGGHVRHVGDQDLDLACEPGGQRLVQVALVDVPGDVPPGAGHGGRVDVHGMHLGLVHGRGQRGADRAIAPWVTKLLVGTRLTSSSG